MDTDADAASPFDSRRVRPRRSAGRGLAVGFVLASVATTVACGGSASDAGSGTTTSVGARGPATTSPSTTAPVGPGALGSTPPGTVAPVSVEVSAGGVSPISPAYRQGVARHGDDWIFTNNDGLHRATGPDLVEVLAVGPAIPPELASLGFDHLGDLDVDEATGVLWIAVEHPDKDRGIARMAAYDPTTLAFLRSFEVAQHHAAFVTIDAGARIAYSQDQFGGTELLRYRIPADPEASWERLEPLVLSAEVDRVQGADVADGWIWLSTDDDRGDGVYRVEVASGRVERAAGLSRPELEGEGIDVSPVDGGPLAGLVHVMAAGGVDDGRLEHFSLGGG